MKNFEVPANINYYSVKDNICTNTFGEKFLGIAKDIVTFENRTCHGKN